METDEIGITLAVFTNEPQMYGNLISQYRFDADQSLWLPSYYHYDALGSTRELTDADEDITDTWMYDAWGSVLARTGTTINPFQFIGELGYYFDIDTQTSQVRARDYEPSIARWQSVDPLFLFTQEAYRYAQNNPVIGIDPSGLQEQLNISGQQHPDRLSECQVCGGANIVWNIMPPRFPLVTKTGQKRRPVRLAIVQYICFSYKIDLCDSPQGKCVDVLPTQQGGCCVYEYLGIANTARNAGRSGFVLDHWQTPALTKPPCSSRGSFQPHGDVRTFELSDKVVADLTAR